MKKIIVLLFLASIGLQLVSADLDAELQTFLESTKTRSLVGIQSVAVQNLYKSYKTEYNRNPKTAADDKVRLLAFNKSLSAIIDNYRQVSKTITLGLNQFSDWTDDELRVLSSGVQVPKDNNLQKNSNSNDRLVPWQPKSAQTKAALPTSYDLTQMIVTGTNVVPILPVKNQGQCGSCYAFAFICLLEFQYALQMKSISSLSEQQLVDCSIIDGGCNGGYFTNTFTYIRMNQWQTNGGLSYPYKLVANQCAFNCSGKDVAKLWQLGYLPVQSNNAIAMQNALTSYGPLWVSVFAGDSSVAYQSIYYSFSLYKTGVFQPSGCPTSLSSTNHAVVIVGYGVDASTGVPYWKVRNSWGAGWGEGGYFKIKRGVNMCGIESGAFAIGRVA